MAYVPTESFVSTAGRGSAKRVWPTSIQPKTFASGSGTIAAGTPVAYNTSLNQWVPFVNAGANGAGTCKGIAWPDAIVLSAGGEVIGQVMMEGKIHFDDIVIAWTNVLANIQTMARSGLRDIGILVYGLDQVR